MYFRYLTLLIAAFFVCFGADASIPAGYYSALKGKSGSNLKTTLHQIIRPHTLVSSYQNLPQYFQKTDTYPNSTRWWEMYSDEVLYAPSFRGLNREHSLPKSWWGGSQDTPAYTDLNHLYPSEAEANMAKSNYPLGKVTGAVTFSNGVTTVGVGQNSGGAKYVFEPADEYKGDFARTYFYMVTCYQDLNWKYTYMCRNGAYPSLQDWAIDLLLEWHRADKVSDKELNRNEQVFLVQNNRNPFIDYPELVEYIWGDKKGQAYIPSGNTDTPADKANLITPPNGMTLDFSQTAVGYPITAQVQFKGESLRGSLELSIGGADRKLFKLSSDKVSAEAANSTSGTWVTVTYTPTELGEHTANLIITDGGLEEGSRVVKMRGESLPVPSLSALKATAATEITDDGFVANWTESVDEVDYYMLTVRHYRKGTVTEEVLSVDNTYTEVTGFAEDDYATYSVQSSRLGILSPQSNVITVDHSSAIGEIVAEQPLVVETFDGGLVRFRCSEPHNGVAVYDFTGRCVRVVGTVTDFMEITLAPGAYFVVSENHYSPLKTVVR